MNRYDRAMLKLDALTQGKFESPTTYGKWVWKLFLQVDEDDESWVVRKFINGIADEEFWRILRAERNHNRSMTLDAATKRLKALYEIAKETDYDPDPDSEDEYDESDCDSQFTEFGSPFAYIVVNTMPHHILSDPAAFKEFLARKNFRPSFDWSGPFSRQSIQALQAEHGRRSPAASDRKHNEAAEESPMVIAESVCMSKPDNTSGQSERMMEMDTCSQSKQTAVPRNELPPPDLWSELPFLDDATVDPTSGIAAIGPMADNAQSELSSETLEAADCELEILSFVDESMEWYQNSTGEKEVEKWREKDCFLRDGNEEKAVSTIDLGAKMNRCARDLIDSGLNPDAVGAAGMQDEERLSGLATSGELGPCAERINHGTTEEPESSGGSHSSDDIAMDAIQNPSTLPIRTASEWDPGPGASMSLMPAIGEGKALCTITFVECQVVEPCSLKPEIGNLMKIVAKTIIHEPTHPVAEFLWPPEFGVQQVYENSRSRSIAIPSTRLVPECLSNWKATLQATGTSSTSLTIQSLEKPASFVLGGRQQSTSWTVSGIWRMVLREIWQALRGELGGRRIWDPGGEVAKFLLAVGRGG